MNSVRMCSKSGQLSIPLALKNSYIFELDRHHLTVVVIVKLLP